MNTTFISAALRNMDPQLVRACALWAALRICEHETPSKHIVSGLVDSVSANRRTDSGTAAALDESCPSGVRSALFALGASNFRIHADHALVELAKQQGLHFVHAMLADIFETNTSPLEVAA